MLKSKSLILLIVIIVVVYSGMIINDSKINESFLSPGKYPVSVTQPLLYENYLVKENPGASAQSHSDQYINYPIFPATSCGTNNLRYWRLPTDGQCSRADMCGGLYKKTEPKIPALPKMPKWGQGLRVNFYDTCLKR